MVNSKDNHTKCESDEIFNNAIKKYDVLLKSNLKDELLHLTALDIIESTPEKMHNKLMIKFTYMLGYDQGLTEKEIYAVLNKS